MYVPVTAPVPISGATGNRNGALVLVAIVVLALNLRLSVNALGAVLPEIRVDLSLSGTAAGILTALPPLVFATAGIATPAVAARLGHHRAVVVALVLAVCGQLIRSLLGGSIALFGGTLVTLAGLAIGNVLMPGLIRLHFPSRITTITAVYVTVLSLGAAIGAGATIPIQNGIGGSWRTGLAVWAAVTALALIPWIPLAGRKRGRTGRGRSSTVALNTMRRSRLAWSMACFFGLQAAQAYVVLSWLGQVLLDAGIGEVQMGALLAVIPIIGVLLSLLTPMLMRLASRIRLLIVLFGTCSLVGYLGLLLAPAASGGWVWMSFLGVGGGTFPAVLTLVALRARTADGVVALSAFTQSVGYVLAALGPVIFGLLHDLTGGWQASLLVMTATLLPMVLVGLRLARPRYLEDELGAPGP